MAHEEPGDPSTFPTNILVLDDGDQHDAASIAVGLEGLADRTAYLLAKAFRATDTVTVTASASVVAPADAVAAIVVGSGAGGGGGGGAGDPGSFGYSSGGGGGGGAIKSVDVVPVVGGESYAVAIGGGGAAGAAGASGNSGGNGGAGGDTTLTRTSTSTVVFTARGAGGGLGGQITTSYSFTWGLGGTSVKHPTPGDTLGDRPAQECSGAAGTFTDHYRVLPAQHGANGVCRTSWDVSVRQYHFRGGASPQGFLGGRSGTSAGSSSTSTYIGGGIGGGGGAGAFGVGGNGGNGGNASSSTVASNGTTNATGPDTNGGGGGGGGGAAGAGATSGAAGAAGQPGASGRLQIVWLRGAT